MIMNIIMDMYVMDIAQVCTVCIIRNLVLWRLLHYRYKTGPLCGRSATTRHLAIPTSHKYIVHTVALTRIMKTWLDLLMA